MLFSVAPVTRCSNFHKLAEWMHAFFLAFLPERIICKEVSISHLPIVRSDSRLKATNRLELVWNVMADAFYNISRHLTSLHLTSIHVTSLHRTSLHVTRHHYFSPHFTTLHITSLHLTSHHVTSLHRTSLQYTSPHFTSPHIITSHLTSLHFTSLQYTSHHTMWPHFTTPHFNAPHLTSLHVTPHYFYFQFIHGFGWGRAVIRIFAVSNSISNSYVDLAEVGLLSEYSQYQILFPIHTWIWLR
jgi:hypothetical protein